MASLENKLRRGLWSIADGHAVSCLRADCRSISKNRLRLPTRIERDRVSDSGWNHFGLSPGPGLLLSVVEYPSAFSRSSSASLAFSISRPQVAQRIRLGFSGNEKNRTIA